MKKKTCNFDNWITLIKSVKLDNESSGFFLRFPLGIWLVKKISHSSFVRGQLGVGRLKIKSACDCFFWQSPTRLLPKFKNLNSFSWFPLRLLNPVLQDFLRWQCRIVRSWDVQFLCFGSVYCLYLLGFGE